MAKCSLSSCSLCIITLTVIIYVLEVCSDFSTEPNTTYNIVARMNTLSLHPARSDPPFPSLLVLSSSSLPSSPLPAAGVETVFQGRGECDYSPPPSTPPPSELEYHLQAMFTSCDPCMTGLVSARTLVEYLSSLVDLQDKDSWKVEELSRMLDHTGDNEGVGQQLFISVGRDWVEKVLAREVNRTEEQMGDEEQQQEKKREERELREVRHQLDRLREEHSELLRTVSVTEDLVLGLTSCQSSW